MLFLLLKFLYIIILSFLYGYNFHRLLNFLLVKEQGQLSLPLTVFTGIFCISIYAAILSIFLPLGPGAHLLILGGGVLNYLFQKAAIRDQLRDYIRQAKAATTPLKVFFSLAVLYVIYLSAQQSFTYDEGLYYAQFIKWMQYYPTVPGLANLHIRFGFNSHWHVIAAVFNGAWIPGNAGNQLNGVLFLMTVLYLLPREQDSSFIRLLKLGLLVFVNMPHVCVYNMVAPAADLPVFYIGCLLVVVWLENKPGGLVFLVLAPFFLITVKISALPVLLLTAFITWQALRQKSADRIMVIISLGIVTLLPWLVRNVILTGYPLFPMELPDVFHTGWDVPKATIHSLRKVITAFAFYRTADVERFAAESSLQHFRTWFMENLRIYDKVLVLVAIISPVIVFLRRKFLPEKFLQLYIFLLLGFGFWLLQAPDPRFAYGYLAPLFIITVILILPRLRVGLTLALLAPLVLQAGTIALQHKLYKTFVAEGMVKPVAHPVWLTPAPYTTQPVAVHNNIYVPVNSELCWDTPLPCADHMPQGVIMRGNSLGDGFKVNQPSGF